MGTSAVIFVQGLPEVCVYKHFDGYEEGTLPWLKQFNKEFTKARGDDPQYKFAQLLRSSVRNARKFRLDTDPATGWGVFPTGRVQGQYEYTLLADGTVAVVKPKR